MPQQAIRFDKLRIHDYLSSHRTGIRAMCGKKRIAVQLWTTQQDDALIKGGLMEPNGILCQVQPANTSEFYTLLLFIFLNPITFFPWP